MADYKVRYKEYRKELIQLGYNRLAKMKLEDVYPERDVSDENDQLVKLDVIIKGKFVSRFLFSLFKLQLFAKTSD